MSTIPIHATPPADAGPVVAPAIETSKPLGLKYNELSRLLNVSDRTIRSLDQLGKIPAAIMLGRVKRWNRVEIEDWFAAGGPDRKTWEAMKAAKAKGARR